MKTMTAAVSLAVLATGAAGAAVGYVSAAPPPSPDRSVSAPAPAAPQVVAPHRAVRVKVRFRHCRPGARLEHGKCVRHVVHTVVEPVPVTAAVTSTSSVGQSGGTWHPRHREHEHTSRPRGDDDGAATTHESEGPEDHESDEHPEPPEPSDD